MKNFVIYGLYSIIGKYEKGKIKDLFVTTNPQNTYGANVTAMPEIIIKSNGKEVLLKFKIEGVDKP